MKPFLKWVGGKTQILDTVLQAFPAQMDRYFEPFVGGGSVLLGMLQVRHPRQVIVSDINETLIELWKNVQSRPKSVYESAAALWKRYDEKATMEEKRQFYYDIRDQYNRTKHEPSLETATLFLFMNKTGFRGMYRENSKGKMNIPFGNYKKTPMLPDVSYWEAVSELIQPVVFQCIEFQTCMNTYIPTEGDFVYCDPPYVPETLTSFTAYTKRKIDGDFHKAFFQSLHALRESNVRVVMSNAAVPLVRDAFQDWNVQVIRCRRAINSKDPSATAHEVIVSNV